MATFYSELVSYHEVSPDPVVDGCMNTRQHEDGVVFNGVEPMEGTHLFIGRTSLVEAVALMYGLTPNQVIAKLSPKTKKVDVK